MADRQGLQRPRQDLPRAAPSEDDSTDAAPATSALLSATQPGVPQNAAPKARAHLLSIQSIVGNQAVQRLLAVSRETTPTKESTEITKEVKTKPGDAFKKYFKSTWSDVKTVLADKPALLTYMGNYRKWYVDNLLTSAKQENNLSIVADSGSRDPESDYDITVSSTDHSKDDKKAVQSFNQFFSNTFGKPSGVVFDTNLYAKDMGPAEEGLSTEKDKESKTSSLSNSQLLESVNEQYGDFLKDLKLPQNPDP